MSLLCAGTGCVAYGCHMTGCAGDPYCTGCQPKPAADGLRLCIRCVDLLKDYFLKAAENHHALLLVLSGTRQGLTEVVSGTRDRSPLPNMAAASGRFEIEEALSRWAHYVNSRRGFSAVDRGWDELAAHLANNAMWLAAQQHAGDVFEEFRELAHGWVWRAAYPSGRRTHTLGVCPMKPCVGFVVAHMLRENSLSPDYVACNTDPRHRWDRTQFASFWPRLADLDKPPMLSAAEVATVLGVSEDSVRQLVRAKRLRRAPGGGFDPAAVLALRQELWDGEANGGAPPVALRLYDETSERPHIGRARVPNAAARPGDEISACA